MNILFFSNYLVGGGAERTILNLTDFINKNCDDVNAYYCACFHDEKIEKQYENIIVLRNSCDTSDPILIKLIKKLKIIRELKELKKKKDISTSISFLPGSDWINLLSGIGEKKVASIRNTESLFITSPIRRWFFHIVWNRFDKVVSISRAVKDDLIDNFGVSESKIITIYNPSPKFQNVEADMSKRAKRVISNKTYLIVTAGRLTYQKGQWHLIKAAKVLLTKYKFSNFKIYILGCGELENYFKGLIKELGLENNIVMQGFVDNPQEYLLGGDLFVFPSLCEGLGNVLVEAITCGIPIISTDCPHGPRELLAPKTNYRRVCKETEFAEYGILIPPFTLDEKEYKNPKISPEDEKFADIIYSTLMNAELRNEYKSKEMKRAACFKIENIVTQWLDII